MVTDQCGTAVTEVSGHSADIFGQLPHHRDVKTSCLGGVRGDSNSELIGGLPMMSKSPSTTERPVVRQVRSHDVRFEKRPEAQSMAVPGQEADSAIASNTAAFNLSCRGSPSKEDEQIQSIDLPEHPRVAICTACTLTAQRLLFPTQVP